MLLATRQDATTAPTSGHSGPRATNLSIDSPGGSQASVSGSLEGSMIRTSGVSMMPHAGDEGTYLQHWEASGMTTIQQGTEEDIKTLSATVALRITRGLGAQVPRSHRIPW